MSKPKRTTTTNTVAFQHNYLIRTPLRMGNLEAKIFVEALRLIRQGRNGHTEFPPINIPVTAIIGKVDTGQAYEAIKQACEALYAKDLNLMPVGSAAGYSHTRIVSDIEHIKGTNTIRGNFAPKIKPYLLQLAGNFTSADITTLLTMNPNAQRLYWILKSYANSGPANATTVEHEESISNLKLLLLENVELYPVYAEFIRRVIDPILNPETGEFYRPDVNFKVQWEPLKDGRRTTGIKFIIPKDRTRKPKVLAASAAGLASNIDDFKAFLSGTKDRKLQAAYVGLREKNQLTEASAQAIIRYVASNPDKQPSFYTTRYRITNHKDPISNMRSFTLKALNVALSTDFK